MKKILAITIALLMSSSTFANLNKVKVQKIQNTGKNILKIASAYAATEVTSSLGKNPAHWANDNYTMFGVFAIVAGVAGTAVYTAGTTSEAFLDDEEQDQQEKVIELEDLLVRLESEALIGKERPSLIERGPIGISAQELEMKGLSKEDKIIALSMIILEVNNGEDDIDSLLEGYSNSKKNRKIVQNTIDLFQLR